MVLFVSSPSIYFLSHAVWLFIAPSFGKHEFSLMENGKPGFCTSFPYVHIHPHSFPEKDSIIVFLPVCHSLCKYSTT